MSHTDNEKDNEKDRENKVDKITQTHKDLIDDMNYQISQLTEEAQQSYMQFHTQKLILSRKYTFTKLSTQDLIKLLTFDYATPLRIDLANHSKSTVANHLGVHPNVITTILTVIQALEEGVEHNDGL